MHAKQGSLNQTPADPTAKKNPGQRKQNTHEEVRGSQALTERERRREAQMSAAKHYRPITGERSEEGLHR